eukprot:7559447-Pyramimonas_sp.AAC.1
MGHPAGEPATAKLDTDSANVAEGSGENLPEILRLRGAVNARAILILEKGNEKMVIPGADMHRLRVGKGAGVIDL